MPANLVNPSNVLPIPIDAAVIIPPIATNPPTNIFFNRFIFSVLPLAKAFNKSIPVLVNQPPASIKKKSVNLVSADPVFSDKTLSGAVNAPFIFCSNSFSLASLKPCSANNFSLLVFACSLDFSN